MTRSLPTQLTMSAGVHYRIADDGCWEWLGSTDKVGYGLTKGGLRKVDARAHRAAAKLAGQEVPEGYDVHHTCKNIACVNPDHLEAMHYRDHDVQAFLNDRAGGLTLDDVREIRRLGRIQGYTSKMVAEMFGIHWRTVDDYWGSRRWALEFNDGPCRPVCLCPVCDGTFVAEKHRLQRYCSPTCKRKANERRKAHA